MTLRWLRLAHICFPVRSAKFFNRKSISRNTLYPQSWKPQAILTGESCKVKASAEEPSKLKTKMNKSKRKLRAGEKLENTLSQTILFSLKLENYLRPSTEQRSKPTLTESRRDNSKQSVGWMRNQNCAAEVGRRVGSAFQTNVVKVATNTGN